MNFKTFTEAIVPTRKEFREYLNRTYPFDPNNPLFKGKSGKLGSTKRNYGDYLWNRDREMFENDYQEFIKEQKSTKVCPIQILMRGIANVSPEPDWDPEVAKRVLSGTATIEDFNFIDWRHLGHNWWREGEEGITAEEMLESAREYAYTESTELLKQTINWPRHEGDGIIGSIAIVFVAKAPKVPENDWSGEIPSSTKLIITELHYDAGNGWVVLPINIQARP